MKTCWSCSEEIPADELECPLCGEAQDPPPFVAHAVPRETPAWLPDDLRGFYRHHEGLGMDDTSRHSIRVARLAELKRLSAKDVYIESADWASFDAIAIGAGSYGDWICYVLSTPVTGLGAIMAAGGDVSGPGGDGPARREGTLVLANDFRGWLRRLREDGWQEYGLTPGSLASLPDQRRELLKKQYRALNPGIKW